MTEKTGARFLIVNADDFGITDGVNRGIIEAHERGVVTSVSLMVRAPAAESAAEYGRAHPALSVGLHFDLEEWRFREGAWKLAYQVVDAANEQKICEEFERQCVVFERLLGRAPTHLDSHQHVHLTEPTRSIMLQYADRLEIPLRMCTLAIAYCGSFYGQTDEGGLFPGGISGEAFDRLVQDQSPGWMEMGCHPGYADGLDSIYAREREEELRVLTSTELRTALDASEVQLRSFADLEGARANSQRSLPRDAD